MSPTSWRHRRHLCGWREAFLNGAAAALRSRETLVEGEERRQLKSVLPDQVMEMERTAHRAAIILTTNLPFSEWTQVFPNARSRKARLDRVTGAKSVHRSGAIPGCRDHNACGFIPKGPETACRCRLTFSQGTITVAARWLE